MKINPRLFPTIIFVTFVLFLLVALLAGLRPSHGGQSSANLTSFVLSALNGGAL
jgi:hypothetical protein